MQQRTLFCKTKTLQFRANYDKQNKTGVMPSTENSTDQPVAVISEKEGFHMNWKANWIAPKESMGDVAPLFCREFACKAPLQKAMLTVTAMGVYEVTLNGSRVSNYVLAPGWTVYAKRHQYQEYDVTSLVSENNDLRILVGRGWYRGPWRVIPKDLPAGLIAQLELTYADGTTEVIATDESWQARESVVRYCDLYHGETADARVTDAPLQPVIGNARLIH